jgi:hypothetical protein
METLRVQNHRYMKTLRGATSPVLVYENVEGATSPVYENVEGCNITSIWKR